MKISRRHFVGSATAGAVAMHSACGGRSGAGPMPSRILGRTGTAVSILAFGGGSRLLTYGNPGAGIAAIRRGLDLGINYFDTAYAYGNGQSESWIGEAIEGRRQDVWLATKIDERNADSAMRILAGSLKRLRVDQVDLIHVHSLGDDDDLAIVERKGGLLDLLRSLRDQKVTRFIGVTSHTSPRTLATALERHDFDCTQMALNAAMMGFSDPAESGSGESFEETALPVAVRKQMGITAMKVFGQERLLGTAPAEQLLRYVLTLPVAAVVAGMPSHHHIEQNVEIAKAFHPLTEQEMRQLSEHLSRTHKGALDRYFARHVDV